MKCECSRERHQCIKQQNKNKVNENHNEEFALVLDWRDEGRQRMMTHKRVHTDSKQIGNSLEVGHCWMSLATIVSQSNDG